MQCINGFHRSLGDVDDSRQGPLCLPTLVHEYTFIICDLLSVCEDVATPDAAMSLVGWSLVGDVEVLWQNSWTS